MFPSIDRDASLLGLVRRLWLDQLRQPLVMGMVVLMVVVNVSNGLTQAPSTVKAQGPATEQPQTVTSLLPLSGQERARIHHRWMTEAVMTSHTLTAAHFFGRSGDGKSSAELQIMTKRG